MVCVTREIKISKAGTAIAMSSKPPKTGSSMPGNYLYLKRNFSYPPHLQVYNLVFNWILEMVH